MVKADPVRATETTIQWKFEQGNNWLQVGFPDTGDPKANRDIAVKLLDAVKAILKTDKPHTGTRT